MSVAEQREKKKVGYGSGEKRGHDISCNRPQSTVWVWGIARYSPARTQRKTENAKRESVKDDTPHHNSTVAVSFIMLCGSFCVNLRDRLQPWIRDYDRLQSFAVILIYLQIGCALIGSLGASYNGVSLVNLAVALFALVAIESSSQSLGRTYAFLLFCAILLDVSWFILFAHEIWNISTQGYTAFFIFSVKLTLAMQSVGFTVRLSSSLLWIQIYRLGASYLDTVSRAADSDLRGSFLSPVTPAVARQCSNSNEILGGSIYDPSYYSSLFEDGLENRYPSGMLNHDITQNESTSFAEVSHKSSAGRSYEAVDEENGNQEGNRLK
ncbi:unnamed protein product [Sphenostylis stenocarpa]|uniref:Uncharacterized protein n=1 Tax=Sphenostylis stenocarpa TaxID=92480 RepID=A0AA86SH28_9FABA|nr:unnamed protein product [Sphenostylis stenocarpa]